MSSGKGHSQQKILTFVTFVSVALAVMFSVVKTNEGFNVVVDIDSILFAKAGLFMALTNAYAHNIP